MPLSLRRLFHKTEAQRRGLLRNNTLDQGLLPTTHLAPLGERLLRLAYSFVTACRQLEHGLKLREPDRSTASRKTAARTSMSGYYVPTACWHPVRL